MGFMSQDIPAGFLADSLFLTLLNWFGAYSFLLYGGIAAAGGAYSYMKVPETKGRTLAEIQELITGRPRNTQEEVPAQLEPQGSPGCDAQHSPSQSGALLSAGTPTA